MYCLWAGSPSRAPGGFEELRRPVYCLRARETSPVPLQVQKARGEAEAAHETVKRSETPGPCCSSPAWCWLLRVTQDAGATLDCGPTPTW